MYPNEHTEASFPLSFISSTRICLDWQLGFPLHNSMVCYINAVIIYPSITNVGKMGTRITTVNEIKRIQFHHDKLGLGLTLGCLPYHARFLEDDIILSLSHPIVLTDS